MSSSCNDSRQPVATISAVALTVCLLTGCMTDGYLARRGADLTDIIDVKIGVGVCAGAKVEVTDFATAGVGLGWLRYYWETFGRQAWDSNACEFHVGLLGVEGPFGGHDGECYCLGIVYRYDDLWHSHLKLIDRFRVGAEVWAVLPAFGIYLNLGEVCDFVAGLAGYDPAGDDDLSKGSPLGQPVDDREPEPASSPSPEPGLSEP